MSTNHSAQSCVPDPVALEEIARKTLGVPTLAVRNRDCLDFHDIGVASLKEALEQAWRLGAQSAKKA